MPVPTTPFEDSTQSNPPWTTLAEAETFLQAVQSQSQRMSYDSLGPSVNGNPINLIRVGYPLAPTDSELKKKSVMLVVAEMHGDEESGRDASFQFLRDLAFSEDPVIHRYLERHPILFIPTMNPDNLASTRQNANGVDLNSCWLDASQPETLAATKAIRDFSPDIVLDFHEMVPSPTQYEMLGSLNTAVDPRLRIMSDELKQEFFTAIRSVGQTAATFTGSDSPRILRNYGGLNGAVSVLIETSGHPAEISHKNKMVGLLSLMNSAIRWHSVNETRINSVTADSRLLAVSEGASQVEYADPVNYGEIALGYRLKAPDAAVVENALDRLKIKTYLIDGSTDFYVPMSQQNKRALPFLVDALSSNDLVQGTRILSVPPALSSPDETFNVAILRSDTNETANAEFDIDGLNHETDSLEPSTHYKAQVQSQTGSRLSSWSTAVPFLTGESVTGLFNIEWREQATQSTNRITNVVGVEQAIYDLIPGETYEFRVQETNGVFESEWSTWSQFDTEPEVNPPHDLQLESTKMTPTMLAVGLSQEHSLDIGALDVSPSVRAVGVEQTHSLSTGLMEATPTVSEVAGTQTHSLSVGGLEVSPTIRDVEVAQTHALQIKSVNSVPTVAGVGVVETTPNSLSPSPIKAVPEILSVELEQTHLLEPGDINVTPTVSSVSAGQGAQHNLSVGAIRVTPKLSPVEVNQEAGVVVAPLLMGPTLNSLSVETKHNLETTGLVVIPEMGVLALPESYDLQVASVVMKPVYYTFNTLFPGPPAKVGPVKYLELSTEGRNLG